MVRVWLRPALAALSRRNAAVNAGTKQALMAQQQAITLRMISSKKDKSYEKKSLHDKFVDIEEELTEVPPEVEFLAKEELELEKLKARIDTTDLFKVSEDLVEEDDEDDDNDDDDDVDDDDVDDVDEGYFKLDDDELKQIREIVKNFKDDEDDMFDDDDEDDEDAELTDAEWASKYERELASVEAGNAPEDDRLYIEMPNYDPSLSMASEGDVDDEDDLASDPFAQWDQGSAYSPEMLNWMLPREKRQPFGTKKDKPWKYFVRANHPDPVELAMDVDLLRLFISPTGRIRPRRFTGLTAKQQRQLARAVKISRQLALLPYLSRYPEPSPEQWRAMEEEEIAKLEALAESEEANGVDDDDDDDEFDDMDEE